MINRVVLVGRLTKNPELRYTPNGVAVANFTIAVNRPFTNQQGDREADFIQVVVWRRQAENAANYLTKGSLAGVDGRLQTRSFENNEGRRVFMTEVVADSVQFLEPKGSRNTGNTGNTGNDYGYESNQGNQFQQQGPSKNNNNNNRQDQNYNPYGDDPFANDGKPIDISDDDLPF
ncbi:single-strand binding protein [Scopulibacillus darangshiensis]|uniref:Single-stranded DNA-binding protein n=1 Tax=Scopulibacillus darangshiensis TaxID=442528 RepID=A0A4V2SKN2_9BACL|nr:single-stranded DNA-binding protein [Scopulibacillus darangshiensis]TCP20026.1 single-strand binding protein [Scopulibacillus darangshiensis]